ncbi:hypothetical protein NHX12_017884 [Muraenolepis orangiensis]|uniref:Cytochrome P450 3A n=1 Tax=Muraenolepis orangiensis TaxID=630683 RepID=A0A9Q0EVQ8_9TELE|nr:hypothetical protein NHX12_017884 [Muraenolepis orangiensis]
MNYLPYFSMETWTLLVTVFTLIAVYAYWPYGTFKRIGVPGPKPIPFFGTMLNYKRGFTTFDQECFNKYGKTWGIYDGRQPVLCTTDISMIKTVLVKECYSVFTNRRNFRLNGPLYDAVSIAEDDHWKRIRSVLSPSFTSGRLKEMFDLMKQHSANLVSSMQKKADKNEVLELKEFFGPYSMDVVTSTAFSVDIDSLNNPSDPFVVNIKKMLKFDFFDPVFLLIAFFPFMAPIFEKMEYSFFPAYVTDFFYTSLKKIKASRLASKQEERSRTSSSSLSFLAYNLALNPGPMTKLQQEIDSAFPNQRVAKATVEINGLVIPKDAVFMVPLWPLHRDPEFWPNPEEFQPERFNKENKERIEPYTYMPFGMGPRNCIGMRFAVVMMKLAMVEILQRFSFVVCDETEVPLEMDVQGLLMPKRPIRVKLEPRSDH